MSDDVLAEASHEIAKAWRAGAQIAEYMARIRQRALARAERTSMEDERRLRQMIEGERRLAEPVYRAPLDKRWWEDATASQAARAHSVAVRFAELDPRAAQAAAECREQARQRWGIDLEDARRPLSSDDLDASALREAAPALPGEEAQDWAALLDDSASQDPQRQEASVTAAPDPLQAERAQAMEWFTRHYGVDRLAANHPAMSSEEGLADYARVLRSAMAAEGLDVDNPPRLGLGHYEIESELNARARVGETLEEVMGADMFDWSDKVNPQDLAPMRNIGAIEDAGHYPELHDWHAQVLIKGSQTLDRVPKARPFAEALMPGTYDDLARRAAAYEAERAGMEVDAYLDFLTPLQRRAMILSANLPSTGHEPDIAKVAAWRISCAQASADRKRLWEVGTAHSDEARSAATAAQGITDKERAEAREALRDSGGWSTPRVRAEQGDAARAAAEEAAWDSHVARQEWADQQLEAGAPPEAVRAAVTGQLALHEPASTATRAPAKARKNGRSRAARTVVKQRQRHL